MALMLISVLVWFPTRLSSSWNLVRLSERSKICFRVLAVFFDSCPPTRAFVGSLLHIQTFLSFAASTQTMCSVIFWSTLLCVTVLQLEMSEDEELRKAFQAAMGDNSGDSVDSDNEGEADSSSGKSELPIADWTEEASVKWRWISARAF